MQDISGSQCQRTPDFPEGTDSEEMKKEVERAITT
jgi:hypothetical protein